MTHARRDTTENGWEENRKMVLTELHDIKDGLKTLQLNVTNYQLEVVKEVTALKTRSTIVSAMLGTVGGAAISLLIKLFMVKGG